MSTPDDELSSLTPEPAGPPVFVDATGRRARRIERLAALVVLACLGYGLALLIAAVTGVPIDGAIVPYPDLGSSPHASHPAPPPSQVPSAVTGAALTHAPTATVTPSPTVGATARPTAAATRRAVPTKSVTHGTGRPTPTATATPTHGKSTAAPGVTHRPTAKPTTANTHSPVAHP